MGITQTTSGEDEREGTLVSVGGSISIASEVSIGDGEGTTAEAIFFPTFFFFLSPLGFLRLKLSILAVSDTSVVSCFCFFGGDFSFCSRG